MKLLKSKKGFTLIELIVVIAILGVLSAIMIPSMNGYIHDSKVARATANARTLYSAAMAANATYPATKIGDPATITNGASVGGTWTDVANLKNGTNFEGKLKDLLGNGFTGHIVVEAGAAGGATANQVVKVQWKQTQQDAIAGEAP